MSKSQRGITCTLYMDEMDFYIDTQSIINIMADGKSIEYLFLEWYRCFLSKS